MSDNKTDKTVESIASGGLNETHGYIFKTWEEFCEKNNKEFLETKMVFSSMDKGVMHYDGLYKDKKIYCSVCETSVTDYDYCATETIKTVTQGYYVFLTVDGEALLNIG